MNKKTVLAPRIWTFVCAVALLAITTILLGNSKAEKHCIVMATSDKPGATVHLAGPVKELEMGWKAASSLISDKPKAKYLDSPVLALVQTKKNGGYAFLVLPKCEAMVMIDVINAMELTLLGEDNSLLPCFGP